MMTCPNLTALIKRRIWATMKRKQPLQRKTVRAVRAVCEALEERQLLAITWVHQPHLQLGDAPLVGSSNYPINGTDQIALVWETTGDAGEAYTVDYAPQGTTNWTTNGVS